jgi:hypothetical protein
VRRPLWTGLAVALLLCGCQYSVEQRGDPGYLIAEIEWKLGETTVADVARSLGPPDGITTWPDERLWFTYTFSQRRVSNLKLSYSGGAFFKLDSEDGFRNTLVVCFDKNDKLLYHATGKIPKDSLIVGF